MRHDTVANFTMLLLSTYLFPLSFACVLPWHPVQNDRCHCRCRCCRNPPHWSHFPLEAWGVISFSCCLWRESLPWLLFFWDVEALSDAPAAFVFLKKIQNSCALQVQRVEYQTGVSKSGASGLHARDLAIHAQHPK